MAIVTIIATDFSLSVYRFLSFSLFVCDVFQLISSSSALFTRSFCSFAFMVISFSFTSSSSSSSSFLLLRLLFLLLRLFSPSLCFRGSFFNFLVLCSPLPSFFSTITSVGSFNRTCRHAMNVVPSVHTPQNSTHTLDENFHSSS